jgi:hypothetical protein
LIAAPDLDHVKDAASDRVITDQTPFFMVGYPMPRYMRSE